jgi:hypothetical protein
MRMWIATSGKKLINLDELSEVSVEGQSVVGVNGGGKVVIHKCEDARQANELYSSIYARISQGARACDAAEVLAAIVSDRQRAAEAQENAKRAQAEAAAKLAARQAQAQKKG